MQKVIIAGGREFNDYKKLSVFLTMLVNNKRISYPFTVVSGMARGADALGLTIAKCMKTEPVKMAADWNKHGKSAGYKRNSEMSEIGDVLVACWDGKSRGTKHMIDTMRKLNKPTYVLRY